VLQPFLDYLGGLNQAAASGRGEGSVAARLAVWDAYLARHPDSPKAEAAGLRRLRLKVRDAVSYPRFAAFHFPRAPITVGYKTLDFKVRAPRFHAAPLLGQVADYRKRFPGSRYTRDVDLLEAVVHGASNRPGQALPLLVGVLNDPQHVELRQDAALAFCAVALRLLDGRERGPWLEAFRANPQARVLLRRLAEGETPLSRLRPMLGALRAGGS